MLYFSPEECYIIDDSKSVSYTHLDVYKRQDDTVVENFKEWNHENQGKRALQKSISSGVWALIVVLYFVISFTTQAWYITWLIFPIGAAVDNIVRACMDLRK